MAVEVLYADILNMAQHGCPGVFRRVICDEAQKLKHLNTLAHKSVKDLEAPLTNLLTATPMLNKPNDLEGLLDLLYDENWVRSDLACGILALDEYETVFREMRRTPLNAANLAAYRWLFDPRAFYKHAAPRIQR